MIVVVGLPWCRKHGEKHGTHGEKHGMHGETMVSPRFPTLSKSMGKHGNIFQVRA